MSYEHDAYAPKDQGGHRGNFTYVIKSLYQGEMPSNRRLTRAFDSANRSIEDRISEGRFSYEGEEMIRDLQALLVDANLILLEKNRGEKLQRMFYHAKQLVKEQQQSPQERGRRATQGQGAAGRRITQEVRDTITALRDLAFTTARSSEFRDVLLDMMELARDVLMQNAEAVDVRQVASKTGKAAKKAAQEAKEGGKGQEKPKHRVRIYQSREPYTFIGERIEDEEESGQDTKSGSAAARSQKGESSSTKPEEWDYTYGGRYKVGHMEDVEYTQRKNRVAGKQGPGAKTLASNIIHKSAAGAMGPIREITSKFKQHNLRENAKTFQENARRVYRSMGQRSNQVKLTPEQKEEFTNRFSRILHTVAQNPSFKRGLRALMLLLTDLRVQLLAGAGKAKHMGESANKNPHLHEMMADLRAFIEEFTGAGSIQHLRDLFIDLEQHIRDDPESTRFLKSMGRYIEFTLENPELLEEKRHVEHGGELLAKSRELMYQYGYEDQTQAFLKNLRQNFRKFFNDPIARKTVKDLQRFVDDFTMDREGKFRFKSELLLELKDLAVPMLIDQLDYIPVPPIEGHSEKMDYWVDNIVFSGRDIIPDQISVETDSSIDIRPRERWQPFTEYRHEPKQNMFTVRARNIRAHAHGIQFWYRRKAAPKREDGGLVDVDIGENGMEIDAVIGVQNPFTPPLFEVHNVDCRIRDMAIHVTESKTDWLYNIGYKVFSKAVRSAIERQVENKLRDMLYDADLWLTDFVQRLLPHQPLVRMPRRLPPKRMLRNPHLYGDYSEAREVPPWRQPYPPSMAREREDRYDTFENYDTDYVSDRYTRDRAREGTQQRRQSYGEPSSDRGFAIRPDVASEEAERRKEERYQRYWDHFQSEYGRQPESGRKTTSRRIPEPERQRVSAQDVVNRMQEEHAMREDQRNQEQLRSLHEGRRRYERGEARPSFHDKRETLRRFPESGTYQRSA